MKRIANRSASEITKDDKAFILAQCAEHGVKVKSKRCLSCYVDAAVELYRILTAESSQGDGEKITIRYRLKRGVDVTYNGERVNAETMTDARAESLIRRGFPSSLFDIDYGNED